jgi:hypothetical protein
LLGNGAPLSAPSIARLKAGWQAEYELWKTRAVADLEVVYLWVDGVYVKAGLEKDKVAILVVLAALRDGRKVIPAVESGYRESTASWAALLRDLKRRGLQAPKLVIGDGHLGIWGAGRSVPRGGRATVLEPSPAEPPRQAAALERDPGAVPAHGVRLAAQDDQGRGRCRWAGGGRHRHTARGRKCERESSLSPARSRRRLHAGIQGRTREMRSAVATSGHA